MFDTIQKMQYRAKANVPGAKAELENRLHDRLELPLSGIHKEHVRIEVSQIRKYFPKSYTSHQMEEKILQMLEANYKKRQRSMER